MQVKDNRTSQSKEKNNWIKPTQKPGYSENNRVVVVPVDREREREKEKEVRCLDKSNFSSSYYRKR